MRLRLSVCFDSSRYNHSMVGVLSSKLGNRAGVHVWQVYEDTYKNTRYLNFNRESGFDESLHEATRQFDWYKV